MCGCRGNYSTNPATIKLICNKLNSLGAEINNDWATAETPTRSYTAYFKVGKYAKDVRPKHKGAHDAMSCPACAGKGRLRTTGGRCDVCGGAGKMTAVGPAGKEPLKLREPGTPSGWGENYRTANDSSRRARLHRALDKVMDRAAARDDASLDQVVKAAGFKRVGSSGDGDDWERDRDGACVSISKTNDEWWAFLGGWDEGGRAGKGAAQLKARL
jgi:hypothetical protein